MLGFGESRCDLFHDRTPDRVGLLSETRLLECRLETLDRVAADERLAQLGRHITSVVVCGVPVPA